MKNDSLEEMDNLDRNPSRLTKPPQTNSPPLTYKDSRNTRTLFALFFVLFIICWNVGKTNAFIDLVGPLLLFSVYAWLSQK